MIKRIALLSLLILAACGSAYAQDPIPCENLAKEVQDGLKAAKLSEPDKTQVMKHRKAGLELCKVASRSDRFGAADGALECGLLG